MMITFYFGSISAKALVCQPHITRQQEKKLNPKVAFSLNVRLAFFFFSGSVLHYKDIKV